MATTNTTRAITAAIKELTAERATIDKAISELEAVLRGTSGGRGTATTTRRKPGRKPAAKAKKVVKKNWSPAARKKAAQRMKKYWAERRKEKAAKKD